MAHSGPTLSLKSQFDSVPSGCCATGLCYDAVLGGQVPTEVWWSAGAGAEVGCGTSVYESVQITLNSGRVL